MPARIWRRFGAEIDFEAEELVGLGDALGDDDLRDAEIDLGEVVDGRWSRCPRLRAVRRSEVPPTATDGLLEWVRRGGLGCRGWSALRVWMGVFHVSHNLGESFVCSGKDGGERAEFCAGFQAAPLEVFQFAVACCFFDVAQAELRQTEAVA